MTLTLTTRGNPFLGTDGHTEDTGVGKGCRVRKHQGKRPESVGVAQKSPLRFLGRLQWTQGRTEEVVYYRETNYGQGTRKVPPPEPVTD